MNRLAVSPPVIRLERGGILSGIFLKLIKNNLNDFERKRLKKELTTNCIFMSNMVNK